MGCGSSTPVSPKGVMPDGKAGLASTGSPGASKREMLAFAQSPQDRRRILAEVKTQPLTDDELKALKDKPQGWMDPDLFSVHMNETWRHYATPADGDDEKRVIDREGAERMARDAVDRWTTIFSERVSKKTSHKPGSTRFDEDVNQELADYLPGNNHDARVAHVQFYFLSKIPLGAKSKDGSPAGARSKITYNEFMFNFGNAFGRLFSFDAGEKKRAIITELAKAYRDKMKRHKKKDGHTNGNDGNGKKDGGNTLHVAPKSENDVKSFKHDKKS